MTTLCRMQNVSECLYSLYACLSVLADHGNGSAAVMGCMSVCHNIGLLG